MCLILIAWRVHPRYPLIVAANRDEFYARPTLPAQRWPGASGMIAGKDLEAGGSWMGVCNGPLDSDWPKVKRGRQLLANAVDRTEPSCKQLFDLLRDQTQAADEALPDTGVGLEWERLLGTIAIDGAIAGKGYGTRSASVLLLDAQGRGQFVEHSRTDDAGWQQREFSIGSV